MINLRHLLLSTLLPYLLSTLLLLGVSTAGCDESTGIGPDSTDTVEIVDTLDSTDTIGTISADTLRLGSFEGETGSAGRCVWVAPYRKSDGSCVRGHWRSAPGETCSWVGTVYKECE